MFKMALRRFRKDELGSRWIWFHPKPSLHYLYANYTFTFHLFTYPWKTLYINSLRFLPTSSLFFV